MDDRSEQHERLIGRVGEVAALTRAIDAACAGHPSLLLVEGGAGIGKTALVEHALRTRQAVPAPVVLRVVGVSWESGLPLGIAEQLVRDQDPQPAQRSDVPRELLETGRLLHRQWSAQQASSPVVVIVDDAHWADVESLRAIRSAIRRMSDERVLVVLVARSEVYEVSEPQMEPDREPSLSVLRTLDFLDGCHDDAVLPGPLTPEEIRTLAHEACGLNLDLPAARQLCCHTGGNPRYAVQLLRELPHETWQDWQPELPAPTRYATSVRHRIARCGEDARNLLDACSVLGNEASLTEAAELAGVADPLSAVDEACAAGLLTATVDPGHLTLSFSHPLVRAAVRTAIGLTRRAALHQRAAAITTDRGRQLAHQVAATTTAHGTLAAELDRYAAERASAGEWATVADILVRASRLSPGREDREDRLLRAVDAMIGAGDVPQATVFAGELESFPAGTLRDVVLGYLAIMRGRPAEADAFLSRALERCNPQRDADAMARICQRRVLHALGRWDARELVAWARRAVELADPSDPSAVESEAVLGLGLAAMGRAEEAVAAYERAAAKLPGGAQPQRFQLGRGWVDLAADSPEEARGRLEAAVPTSYRMGSTRISLWAQGWLARTQFALGSWAEALEVVQRASARLTDVRIELVRPLVHWTGAQIHALRGEWEQADHHVGEAAAAPHDYEVMLVPSCLARAQVAEARGDYERVLEALAPVVHIPSREAVDEPGFWPWPDVYANALVMTGRLDEADAFLLPYEDLSALRGHRSTMARLGLARGRLTAARGDIDTAHKEFEQALAHLEQLPLPYDRARVNFAYGQTLRRAGKRREADTVLHNARDLYLTLGAGTYVERCDRELQAGGVHASRTAPGLSRLTPQEQAVARLVASGATNKQTALELYISIKTVQYHLTHIYAKLGIRSRSELAAGFRDTSAHT
ncbi:helix-turn-helix transcriptional regulator [Streptomyces phaeochromogenes]|uniref:helix-turn-helix transcriptional regulator n=1 Tax=Streptomyces phaeochromogenes TaxID=1923 RepID=UPI002DDB0F3A|nr:AAA family ATPase [Streptomyces phaeochromogenes]WRZ34438.1 AAA family ATPase [Streptomyces phaeochromogenes]